MVGDLRDKAAYGLAIVALGAALTALLVGICWVAINQPETTETFTHTCPLGKSVDCRPAVYMHTTKDVPEKLWYALAAVGGVFVGILVPFSAPTSSLARSRPLRFERFDTEVTQDALFFIAVVFTLGIGIVLAILAAEGPTLGIALAGLLLGFLIPSPARGD